ncbi:MAG: sulfurtransferase [Betaproteobacteria bacterium RIFCSPLOWO2_12_FULL_63_13]|nr:MAG: sulfurtransferase [Betaproteobacteria bacterium RIFCSPLOWO2_02_FULL_63_19]OGA53058.1 MAG: sulfurtransferase [Betaproteobacteria bacterium RIFCSPLOWO2_12_FULL_63_13]
MNHIAPQQLKHRLSDAAAPLLLDVREPWEFQICRIPGSLLMPMGTVVARHTELAPEAETVVICHHGARSMQVAMFLENAGFTRVYNLSGGVDAWARTVEASMPVY